MPEVKYLQPNMLKELFNHYMRLKNISSTEMGSRIHMHPAAVRRKKQKGIWTNEDIRLWCKALEITDPEEVGRAVLNYYPQE